VTTRLAAHPARGQSIEAWARRSRYRALREMALARGVDLVLLAHHRRDQAETFLLQALRGGGVAALSAMPKIVRRDGVTWARPWIEQPRQAIEAYARRHRLRWIEDESNDDDRFARNRLRRHVWPALVASFADAEGSLADAAQRVQDAAAVVDEIAAGDLAAIADEGGLDLAAWRALPVARRASGLAAVAAQRASRATAGQLGRAADGRGDRLGAAAALACRRRRAAQLSRSAAIGRVAVCAGGQAEPGGRLEPCGSPRDRRHGTVRFASTASKRVGFRSRRRRTSSCGRARPATASRPANVARRAA
jgi:tRNA(Ile)-lysidine synthase